jgi:hypothetical protein
MTAMNTLINTALNPLVGILRRSGLLAQDLDYHIVRAAMVIMFFFFGYQKWWAYATMKKAAPSRSSLQCANVRWL